MPPEPDRIAAPRSLRDSEPLRASARAAVATACAAARFRGAMRRRWFSHASDVFAQALYALLVERVVALVAAPLGFAVVELRAQPDQPVFFGLAVRPRGCGADRCHGCAACRDRRAGTMPATLSRASSADGGTAPGAAGATPGPRAPARRRAACSPSSCRRSGTTCCPARRRTRRSCPTTGRARPAAPSHRPPLRHFARTAASACPFPYGPAAVYGSTGAAMAPTARRSRVSSRILGSPGSSVRKQTGAVARPCRFTGRTAHEL